MTNENYSITNKLINSQEKQLQEMSKRGTHPKFLANNTLKNVKRSENNKVQNLNSLKKIPRPLPRLQKCNSAPQKKYSSKRPLPKPKPLPKRINSTNKIIQISHHKQTLTNFNRSKIKEEEKNKIDHRLINLNKYSPLIKKQSLVKNMESGSENEKQEILDETNKINQNNVTNETQKTNEHNNKNKSNKTKKTNETNETKEQKENKKTKKIPPTLWLAKLMKEHPEILQTRERIIPLTNQSSFGKLFRKEKTENIERIGGKEIFHIIYQFLLKEGLTESSKLLQKESKIQLNRHYSKNDALTTLLFLSVSDVDNIWSLNYQKLWEHLGEIEKSEVLTSVRKAPLLAEEEDGTEDINIWDEPEENNNNILYLDSEDKTTKILHAANLNQIILKITNPKINDPRIMDIFLMTYQSFTSPGKLLLKLFQRFQIPNHLVDTAEQEKDEDKKRELEKELRTINLRTFHVLKRWIENHFADFNEGLLEEVNKFIESQIKNPINRNLMEILKKSIKNQLKGNNKEKLNHQTPPEPKVPKNIFSKSLTLFDIDEEEIARQISIIDFGIFSKIRPAELLNCAWSKDKLKHRAKNVLKMTERFNAMSEWVATLIIQPERVRQRAKVLKTFINIAKHLYQLKNFNSLISILSGINSSAVHRLSYSFAELAPKTTEIVDNLKTLMSGKDNYKKYRELLKNAQLPCIPFLGFYQTDLTFIEDGNADYIDGLINFSKRSLVYDVIYDIEKYQVKHYNLHPVYQIAVFLNKFPRMDKKILYKMSLEREPRKATRDKILF
ncbi:ras guanine nucleotide exchange factor i-related [Anaeramoeba flamelloides]|uniref:Ras guanine nucleotide exchange factor i-related n=1 Tax=Anaeramoeba flamelloides TaxID=1746091 RepID=A0ABQ8YAV1_9EUKA|nr:ras guanine nucleotide exchange factor i-related [Anaeramoeba flamelloides]